MILLKSLKRICFLFIDVFFRKFNEIFIIIVIVDNNTLKLSNTYYSATSLIPEIVGITSASSGTLSPINPTIKLYKNSKRMRNLNLNRSNGFCRRNRE